MNLEERLEQLANRTPPGDPADVLAAARARAESRPGTRRPTLVATAAAVVAVVALAAGAFTLAGDDGSDSVTVAGPGDAEPALDEWGPLAVVDGAPSGDGALISGTLAVDGNCVTLRGPDQEQTLLVWPSQGTGWDSEANAVEYAAGNETTLLGNGDSVSFGGGGSSAREDGMGRDAWVESVGDWVAEPDPSCAADTRWFVGDLVAVTHAGNTCGPDDGSRPSARCGGVDGPVMFGPESHAVMEQALLAGSLVREGDCLYLAQTAPNAGSVGPVPVVWPYGTAWQDDPAGVSLPDGTFVPVGAEFTASGGGHDIDRLVELGHAAAVAGRARSCAAEGIGTVAYVQGEVTVGDSDPEPRSDVSDEDAGNIMGDFLRLVDQPSEETVGRLPFADEVRLGLGSDLHVVRSRSELADPQAWVIDEETFRAYTGPFSALDVAAGAQGTVVSVGEHPHCASPPIPPPDEIAGLSRVSVQPELDDNASCLQWWTVDLFVNESGLIEAVTLDLWEP